MEEVTLHLTKLNNRREITQEKEITFNRIHDTYKHPSDNKGVKIQPSSLGRWILLDGKRWYLTESLNMELVKEPTTEGK